MAPLHSSRCVVGRRGFTQCHSRKEETGERGGRRRCRGMEGERRQRGVRGGSRRERLNKSRRSETMLLKKQAKLDLPPQQQLHPRLQSTDSAPHTALTGCTGCTPHTPCSSAAHVPLVHRSCTLLLLQSAAAPLCLHLLLSIACLSVTLFPLSSPSSPFRPSPCVISLPSLPCRQSFSPSLPLSLSRLQPTSSTHPLRVAAADASRRLIAASCLHESPGTVSATVSACLIHVDRHSESISDSACFLV